MRFLFYIFIVSQLINIVGAFADKFTKDSSKINPIKWEKIQEYNSNKLKKIIWKSYKNDKSYFQNRIKESSVIKKLKEFREEIKNNPRQKPIISILEIEPYMPLNTFLNYGDF